PRRAGYLSQPGERLLRFEGEGARPSRSGDRRRPRRRHFRRRVDHRVRRMDQRSRPRSAVQGPLSQDLDAKFDRRDRKISGLRHDPGHRSGLCQEDGQGLRREGLRHHRGRTRSASRGDGHWRGSGQADHRRLGRAEGRPGDYGFPSQQRGRNRPGRPHLQDLRRRRRAGHDREPLSPCPGYPGHRLQDRDAIAMKLGIEKTAMIRLRAGISYALTEAMDEGHCGLPTDQLIPLAEKLLEAPKALILTALELERSDGAVIADKVGDAACMFLAGLYRAEQAIADRLIRIARGRLPWPWIDEAKAIPWVEKRSGLQLADSQKAAIRQALTAKTLVITGGPGVGKTTLVNSILKILAAKGVRLLLCAPTGRAAKRMTEATGVEAKTIHRLLEVDPRSGGFKRN